MAGAGFDFETVLSGHPLCLARSGIRRSPESSYGGLEMLATIPITPLWEALCPLLRSISQSLVPHRRSAYELSYSRQLDRGISVCL
jgi:hypothetical protein